MMPDDKKILELRKKWVEALRSGKYTQTKGQLHDDIGFCCLGVLCDISELDAWERSSAFQQNYNYLNEDMLLPNILLGVTSVPVDEDEDYEGPENFQDTLTDMNDQNGDDFIKIATFIEDKLIKPIEVVSYSRHKKE